MARDIRSPAVPVAEEFDVGDDSDLPGLSQPIGQDDIDAIVGSSEQSVEDRRAALDSMLDDLRARRGMDRSGETAGLIAQIQAALDTLTQPGDGYGTPEAVGLDEDARVEQPDEILERAEEEAEEATLRGVG